MNPKSWSQPEGGIFVTLALLLANSMENFLRRMFVCSRTNGWGRPKLPTSFLDPVLSAYVTEANLEPESLEITSERRK